MRNLVLVGLSVLFTVGISNFVFTYGQQEQPVLESNLGEFVRGQGYGVTGAPQAGAFGGGRGYGRVVGQGTFGTDAQAARPNESSVLTTLTKGVLGTEDIARLMYIWEEEKLARDVYATLGEVYGLPVFTNIARSEQSHMEQMNALIERYGLQTPSELPQGMFHDAELSNLYNELIELGNQSLAQALEVGINIEVMDIDDLQEAIDSIPAEDVQFVLGQLLMGSQNHLAAFQRQAQR